MQIEITYTDGTKEKEYCWESYRVKDGILVISKGRYEPSKHINMQVVKSFQEVSR
jgi:hypothetical protein